MENKRPFKTIYTCFPQGKHKVLTMSYDDGKIFDKKLSRFLTNTVSRVHSTLTQVLCLLMRTEYSFRKSKNLQRPRSIVPYKHSPDY